jgi:hypothetical protein
LLKAWSFPAIYVQAVEHQFQPASAPAEALPLLAHLLAARYLATAMGPGTMEEAFLTTMHGTFLCEWGFTSDMLEAAMPVVLEKASARLGEKLSEGALTV